MTRWLMGCLTSLLFTASAFGAGKISIIRPPAQDTPSAMTLSQPCDQWSFVEAAGPGGPTEVVAAKQGQRVFICGYMVTNSASTLDFQFLAGTGTDCGDNQTPMTPPISVATGASLVNRIPLFGEYTPANSALCVQTSGQNNAGLDMIVYWAQR